jgi:hypothetical protein
LTFVEELVAGLHESFPVIGLFRTFTGAPLAFVGRVRRPGFAVRGLRAARGWFASGHWCESLAASRPTNCDIGGSGAIGQEESGSVGEPQQPHHVRLGIAQHQHDAPASTELVKAQQRPDTLKVNEADLGRGCGRDHPQPHPLLFQHFPGRHGSVSRRRGRRESRSCTARCSIVPRRDTRTSMSVPACPAALTTSSDPINRAECIT